LLLILLKRNNSQGAYGLTHKGKISNPLIQVKVGGNESSEHSNSRAIEPPRTWHAFLP